MAMTTTTPIPTATQVQTSDGGAVVVVGDVVVVVVVVVVGVWAGDDIFSPFLVEVTVRHPAALIRLAILHSCPLR